MISRIRYPIILVTLCIGLTVTVLHNTVVFEAGVRDFAFVSLSKGFLQQTLTLDDNLPRALELFDRVSVYDPARYEPYQLRLKGLIEVLKEDALDDGSDINRLLVSSPSVAYGEWRLAVGHYLRTIAQGATAIKEDAIRELADLLDSHKGMADFGPYMYTDMSGLSSFPVAFDKCAQVELVAIYVSERSVVIRQPVPIVIVWRINTGNLHDGAVLDKLFQQQNPHWELRRSGKFLFQVGTVDNQVTDGGFEQNVLPREGFFPSLPQRIYYTQMPQQTQLVYEFAETGQNMVLLLGNQGDGSIGLGSLPIDISTDASWQAYLISGRYRTVGEAKPYIGIRWLLRDEQRRNGKSDSYILQRRADEWTPFAGILLPHLEAESLQYLVLNTNATSQLYVDNLGLFFVPLPCH